MKKTILVATTNPGKLEELTTLLGSVAENIEWTTLKGYPGIPEVVEDGDSFLANARKKALGYAKATGLWTIADDSGLIVDALNGEPGIYSARYAADECDSDDKKEIDTANLQKVLCRLEAVPDVNRTARFVCRLCLACPEKILLETAGTVNGIIAREPAGSNGFGYDPVFYIRSLQKTVAQLDDDQKNQISHRGNAIRKFKPLLLDLLEAHSE